MNREYEDLLQHVMENGIAKGDRTGTGTKSIFGAQMRFNLSEGFPMITTKKVHLKSIVGELLWFLRGDTKNSNLSDEGVRIWNEWQKSDGTIGPGYSAQWRAWYSPSEEIIEIEHKTDRYANFTYTDDTVDTTPTVHGIGFIGKDVRDSFKREYELWESIVKKVAKNKSLELSPIWHSYEMFAKTLNLVPGYHDWVKSGDFKITPEYFGSNVYGPSTTIFLPKKEIKYLTHGETVLHYGDYKFFTLKDIKKFNKNVTEEELRENVTIQQASAGHSWRHKYVTDQVEEVVKTLRNNPDSRRIIISAWNAGELNNMALMPCHAFIQFYVADGKLSCQLYQRSADLFLGVPFNISSYALLTHMVAQQVGLEVGDFIWSGGDCHIYNDHFEQVSEQLSREPYEFPTLKLKKARDIYSYTYDDIEVENYIFHPPIRAKVSV